MTWNPHTKIRTLHPNGEQGQEEKQRKVICGLHLINMTITV